MRTDPIKRENVAEDMRLPEGNTCGDCGFFVKCNAIYGHINTDEGCDWSPSRFRPRSIEALSQQSKDNIAQAEAELGHATGIGRIDRFECPLDAVSPAACMFCSYGHMLECHYPKTCKEANCSHYQTAMMEE